GAETQPRHPQPGGDDLRQGAAAQCPARLRGSRSAANRRPQGPAGGRCPDHRRHGGSRQPGAEAGRGGQGRCSRLGPRCPGDGNTYIGSETWNRAPMQPVKMYTTPICPYCVRAKSLLAKKGVPIEEIDVFDNDAARQEMLAKSNGARTVPQIFVGDTHVGGFDELYALDKAGK